MEPFEQVVNFFKAHKISTAVAAHFTNAGYDTLDTLTTLSPDSLIDVEAGKLLEGASSCHLGPFIRKSKGIKGNGRDAKEN